MTKKLYYDDAYIRHFASEVQDHGMDATGRPYVILIESAFYPGGGGQPCDLGTIEGTEVTEVIEEASVIKHILKEPLALSSNRVSAQIDWERRFDHMQQHAGQHILSAVFEDLFSIDTVSFHLGKETVTIDLDCEKLDEESALAAEAKANQYIYENHPIVIKWATVDEANQYPLRKKLSVTGDVRLVIIEDFDYNGCGGTHPKSSGEIGLIKIVGWERQRSLTRLTFVCGNRVLKQFGEQRQLLNQLNQLLSSNDADLSYHINRLLTEQMDLEKQMEANQQRLLSFEAQELYQRKQVVNGFDVVAQGFKDKDMKAIQKLASQLTEENERLVILFASTLDDKVQLLCTRSNDLNINMNQLLRTVLPLIDGKGGGSPNKAQGGGKALLSETDLIQKLIEALQG